MKGKSNLAIMSHGNLSISGISSVRFVHKTFLLFGPNKLFLKLSNYFVYPILMTYLVLIVCVDD